MSATRNKKRRLPATAAALPRAEATIKLPPTVARLLAPVILVVATIAMFCWSWRTWPDVMVDFGRELYVPWQISDGEVLYRDLAYFNGPLSPYINSLWFRVFGVGLQTLAFANLAILGVLLYLWYALFTHIGSRVSATLACLVLIGSFAFARYTTIGNYNYICPYSHEATHGVTLAVASFYFLSRYVRGGQLTNVALCGLCVGLSALTKPEILLATLPAAALGVGLACRASVVRKASPLHTALVFLGAIVTPIFLAVALLSLAMPFTAAAAGTLGGWKWVLDSEITSLPFYTYSMGAQGAVKHLVVLLFMLFWYGLLLGIPAGIGLLVWRSRAAEQAAAVACFVVVVTALVMNFAKLPVSDAVAPLPLFMTLALAAAAILWRRNTDPETRGKLSLVLALALFALLMLAKILLYVRLGHYGFYLAMPATLLTIFALWEWVPRAIASSGGSGRMLRAALLAVLLVLVARCLDATRQKFAKLTVPVGSGADAFWADSRGTEVSRLLTEVVTLTPRDATLAVAPEGIMLNYLSRRRNPTPYISLMPVEMLMFGETNMLAAFREQPPDYLIITDQDLLDYGVQNFKISDDGYADLLATWFADHYRLIGELPTPAGLLHGILVEYVRPDPPPARSSEGAAAGESPTNK